MEAKTFTRDFLGRPLKFQISPVAGQANGSVLASWGDTVVLATAVISDSAKPSNYLPLTVEYEERLYAAGKIKGSRFVKREGKPSDESILKGRLIDRAIRPRFNQKIRNDIQVVITILAYDQENDPEILGLNAASLALTVSDIPWAGPIACVRVAQIDQKLIFNPSVVQREKADFELIVAGTESKINMLEAAGNEANEEKALEAIALAQEKVNEINAFQKEIAAEINPQKTEVKLAPEEPEIKAKVEKFLAEKLEEAVYVSEKRARQSKMAQLQEEMIKFLATDDQKIIDQALNTLDDLTDKIVHKNILEKDLRPDGRKLNEVREISCQIGFLPRVHGSALFSRGSTQSLAAVTLGGPTDEQIIENLQPDEFKKRFILHYNFPPFSVGETGRMSGPGRREIGHGALAEKSLTPLIPSKEAFPYTIRVVSEILSSNGSSSMASVCSSSLALMHAGVPIRQAAAGIAMGLVLGPKGEYKVLTDIQGPEDHYGDMDLKIAGTKNGFTGLQMDVKIEGVNLDILKTAFLQAKEARLFILEKMNETIAQPNPDLSKFAPRIITLQINPEKIRDVIGPGGKVINRIIDETGVDIDIEDSGLVFITSKSPEAAEKAVSWVENLTHEVKVGETFQARITRIIAIGAFAEILPGQEGLIHISQLAHYHVRRVEDVVKVGQIAPVKVIGIDEQGRINLSLKEMTENTEGSPETDRKHW
ncbi:MAG: polyribonucleotide nucleotidyltransferase [Candidatus Portnoybacteria bacterium]|nr:polyribonucleotide nucleotidyltransferase [Candidatus Portnoybacteria bacterium]